MTFPPFVVFMVAAVRTTDGLGHEKENQKKIHKRKAATMNLHPKPKNKVEEDAPATSECTKLKGGEDIYQKRERERKKRVAKSVPLRSYRRAGIRKKIIMKQLRFPVHRVPATLTMHGSKLT